MNVCSAFLPWLLWSKKVRTNIPALFVISIFVTVGMWMERFVIIAIHLAGEPFEPWVTHGYNPTWADWGIMAGGFGWFFMWVLLFVKKFPAGSVARGEEGGPPPRGGGRPPGRSRNPPPPSFSPPPPPGGAAGVGA